MTPPPLLIIALDAAELSLLERLAAEGALPEIGRALGEGTVGELRASAHHLAEVPWTEMLTGCLPARTGYWSPFAYSPDYAIREIAAYDFTEHRPFYACCPGCRVVAFDVPQARLCDGIDGMQLLGWGSHTPQAPSASRPAGLLAEINARFGRHPAFPDDFITVPEMRRKAARLTAALLDGIARRSAICRDLMARGAWDLFFVVCAETHSAGHGFWHVGQPDHPLHGIHGNADDPLRRVLMAADRMIGELRAAAPADARLLLFAERGMKANACDLPSFLFLPELLYRHAFGRPVLAAGATGAPPPPDAAAEGDWGLIAWATQRDRNPLGRALRRHARPGVSRRFDRVFGAGAGLEHPYETPLGYLPPVWYRPHWPRMPAFALPSFSDGYVRINLAGREAQGVVEPTAYMAQCDRIAGLIGALRDARTGRPVAAEILRTWESGEAAIRGDPRAPDADLIVKWRDDPADVVDSPDCGRIGPLPFRRSGDHSPRGFFALSGPGIPRRRLAPGRLVDLAPTILALMGAAPPPHVDGEALLTRIGAGA